MSAETERPLSGEDIDVIREDLRDGVSSFLIARDYGVGESLILKAARGNLDYEHDAEHPPLEYDPETAAWSIPEEYAEDPEPPDMGNRLYAYGEGRLWRRTHQVPPWAADGGDSDEHDDADADADADADNTDNATQPTMTTTNTTTADDADSTEEQTQTQTTIGKDKNGETVAGTSPDDFGSISTECWPSHIDPTDVGGELRRRIIQAAAMHRDWGIGQIANHLGCTKRHTRTTLQEHWPSHQALAEATGRALTVDDVDEIRRRMVAGEPPSTLADEYDVSKPTITNAAKGASDYMAAAEHPPLEYDGSEWVTERDEPDTETEIKSETEPEDTGSEDTDSVEEAEEWTNEPALTADEVDEIRDRLVAGETANKLATEYDTSRATISDAARGDKSYARDTDHPAVVYDPSVGGWVVVEDEPDQVALVYGSDVYHHPDASGTPRCGAWEEGEKVETTVRLDKTEAEKVADECPQCRLWSRSTSDLLDDIRAELGRPLKESGSPLNQEELADVLARLRGVKGQDREVAQ